MNLIRPTLCGKIFIVLVIIITVAACIFYVHILKLQVVKHKTKVTASPQRLDNFFVTKRLNFQGDVIVHLDLKGAPPKISYYKELFPLLTKMGATGLLLEYEDMFPFTGDILENVTALNAYSLTDIKEINHYAKQNNLTVIPLVQTFGHLEFILKLEQFKELREVETYPQAICPSHQNTQKLLMDMIQQVIEAHPDSNIIHIGSDEVYYLGLCDKCLNVMAREHLSKNMLFTKHVRAIAEFIKKKYPKHRILMWDDEFRGFTQEELLSSGLHKIVEPVVWKYTKDVMDELGPSLWNLYSSAFPSVWAASAFKGATGSSQYVVDVPHYLENHRSWMDVISNYKDNIKFTGIIITGWQRYDHFAILCELLPVGLPSLAMSMRIIQGHTDSPLTPPVAVAELLQCEQPYGLMGLAFGTPHCTFPGGNVLENVLRLQQVKQDLDGILSMSESVGWLTEYNIRHSFSSPRYVETVMGLLSKVRSDFEMLDSDLTAALQEVYDNYTVVEWRETVVKPFEEKVNAIWKARQALLGKDHWPRRPLTAKEEL